MGNEMGNNNSSGLIEEESKTSEALEKTSHQGANEVEQENHIVSADEEAADLDLDAAERLMEVSHASNEKSSVRDGEKSSQEEDGDDETKGIDQPVSADKAEDSDEIVAGSTSEDDRDIHVIRDKTTEKAVVSQQEEEEEEHDDCPQEFTQENNTENVEDRSMSSLSGDSSTGSYSREIEKEGGTKNSDFITILSSQVQEPQETTDLMFGQVISSVEDSSNEPFQESVEASELSLNHAIKLNGCLLDPTLSENDNLAKENLCIESESEDIMILMTNSAKLSSGLDPEPEDKQALVTVESEQTEKQSENGNNFDENCSDHPSEILVDGSPDAESNQSGYSDSKTIDSDHENDKKGTKLFPNSNPYHFYNQVEESSKDEREINLEHYTNEVDQAIKTINDKIELVSDKDVEEAVKMTEFVISQTTNITLTESQDLSDLSSEQSARTFASPNCILRKSPSFDLELHIEARAEESDQIPLLCQDKAAIADGNANLKGNISEKPKTPLFTGFSNATRTENEMGTQKQDNIDAVENQTNDSANKGVVSTSIKHGGKPSKSRSFFFGNCLCCAAVIN